MFIPHNFADRDPSRQSVQGVRLQLSGKRSGGFAGEWFHGDGSEAAKSSHAAGDLRARSDKKEGTTKARYFGATYEKGVKVPLEALEPDMSGYVSKSDLMGEANFTGVWHREEAFGG